MSTTVCDEVCITVSVIVLRCFFEVIGVVSSATLQKKYS